MNSAPAPSKTERDAPIEVVAYDPSWVQEFELERNALEAALSPWMVGPIEHVGSTAVPGLVAKPIIDIMVAVESLEASREALPVAEFLQYNYWPYKADSMHWFCKPTPEYRTHHLHLVPYGTWLWQARLCFRDALCADDALANAYGTLKQRLAQEFEHDREAYTQGKSEYILGVLSAQGFEHESVPN